MDTKWNSANWRKSTTSDTGACVEIARLGGLVGVRDTKAAGRGPVLEFNETEWRAFLDGVARGEFTFEALSR
jgi:hypothetical protein